MRAAGGVCERAAPIGWVALATGLAAFGCADERQRCLGSALTVVPSQHELALESWSGPIAEPTTVPVAVSDPRCRITAHSDRPWLVPALGPADESGELPLALALIPDAMRSGRDRGTVELLGPDGARAATLTVTLSALRPGPATGPRRALVIGVDGLRPDALTELEVPHLRRLLVEGRASLAAQTQRTAPTKSGPGWASVLTGVEATKHGVDGNDDLAEIDRTYRSLLGRAADHGLAASVATNWFGVALLVEDEIPTTTHFGDDRAVAQAAQTRIDAGDALIFVQLDAPDVMGHLHGFSPDVAAYAQAVRAVDEAVGGLVARVLDRPEVVDETWLFVLTTDHAGVDRDHGPMTPEYQTIPLGFAGPTMPREPLPADASHLDVAPTVLRFLGVPIDPSWGLDGRDRG